MIKMGRLTRHSSVYAIIILSVMLFLQTTAEDEIMSTPTKTTKNSKGLAFIQSEAEKWSFQNQIQKSIAEYLKEVETNANELMRTRYKFSGVVKIPEYSTDLASKAGRDDKMKATAHFTDGWANGFRNISLAGENTWVYEDSTVKFHADTNFWKHLAFLYEFSISEGSRDLKGQIKVNIDDARYLLTTVLDIPNKKLKLVDFMKKSIGHEDVQVKGLEGNGRLSRLLVQAFTGFYRDTVFPDIEAAMRTVLEDSLKIANASELLPKADYENKHPKPQVEQGGLDTCDADAEVALDENELPWESVTDIPFIQNIGEMWAFQKQMDKGLSQLMEHVSVTAREYLAERELLRGKLTDDKFLMRIKDQTSTSRHSPMSLSDGWFYGSFKFNVSRAREVEFHERTMNFKASFHLEEPIEVEHEFKAVYLRKDYEGEVKGRIKFLEYAMKFSLNLKTAELTLEDAKLDCVRDISIAFTGLNSEAEWFSSEVKRNFLKRFKDSTLTQIHSVLSQAFYYVTSANTVEQYLPKWSYNREFRNDLGFRVGELDEDQVETCDAERIQKAEDRVHRFSQLIGHDGVFDDRIPDAKGKYFTHVSGIKNWGIRYTWTKTQSWHFDRELRLKMNEYMYTLLKTTEGIIRIRDLGKVKMPDYKEAANEMYDTELRIEKGWIEGLSSVAITGVDILEYDQKLITLMTNIQVYKDLKYEGEYITFDHHGSHTEESILMQLPPIELSLRIDIDYLGNKIAKMEYMKLECIGENSTYIFPNSRVDRVSDSVDAYFREVMVEHVIQIFRRAFEDAMADTKWEKFLPVWDYKRDYTTEVILHKNMNRFQITAEYCHSKKKSKPTLKEYYPDLKTMEYFLFLPDIKTVSLRRSFLRQIRVLMADAVNTMWRNVVKGPLQRFNPLIFADRGLMMDIDGTMVSLIYSTIDTQGLTSGSTLDEVDFAYGEKDTLIIMYHQFWESIKVNYNLSLANYDNDDSSDSNQSADRDYGTAEATAKGLKYLLKVRFFLSNSTFAVDEFFLECLDNLTVTIQGLRPERDGMLGKVRESVERSFPETELMEIKELLYVLYGYAAKELNMSLYTYSWTYDRELFKIAAEDEDQGHEEETRACEEESKRGNSTVITRGDVPFIGSEAEWWSFAKQMKDQVERFKKQVRKVARTFLREHAIQRPVLPNMYEDISRDAGEERETVTCSLTEGIVADKMNVNYADDTVVEVGEDVKVTSFISFEEDLKVQYRLEAKSDKKEVGGRVVGVAKSLIYKMVVNVNTMEKSAVLESFEIDCMSGFEINATIPNGKFAWVREMFPESFQEGFTSLATGDVKKLLKIAFAFAVKNVDVTPYLDNWNYQKDYGERRKTKDPRKMRDFSIRRLITSTSLELEVPSEK